MDKKTQALLSSYAKSLASVGQEQNCLEQLVAEVDSLLLVFKENDLAKVLTSLATPESFKAKLLDTLIDQSSDYLANFLRVVKQNSRANLLEALLYAFKDEAEKLSSSYQVKVTTAQPLNQEQKSRILALVPAKFGVEPAGLTEELDASLIGGFIISVNNKVIDTSIRRQLQDLKMNLK